MAAPQPAISATEPDWSRERRRRGEWNPGKALLISVGVGFVIGLLLRRDDSEED